MVDIRALSPAATSGESMPLHIPPPKRRWLTRVLIPLAILCLTGSLLGYAARDALWPATPVRVVRVVAKERGQQDPATAPISATVSVQAPGWIEPDPYPVFVTALTHGVVDKVSALEGQTIQAGQIVAEMVNDEARLAVARAQAELSRRQALLTAAQTDWDNPVTLERAVAVNRSLLAESRAKLVQLDAAIAQHEAKLREAQAAYDRVSQLGPTAVSPLQVEQAQFQLDAQRAQLEATRKQRPVIEAKADQYAAELKAAQVDLRLRVSLKKTLDEARASVDEAQAALDEAQLRLSRMKVVSPVSGTVMRRLVAPGAKVMFNMDSPDSAHIVHVYDPARLQVRVDVPLADAAKVSIGQEARVTIDVLADQAFAGRVTRFVHQADISKNTVEVKVAIDAPSPLLKPDMLARVKFLASSTDRDDAASSSSSFTVYAPRLVVRGDGDSAHVWLVTPDGSQLSRRPVRLGQQRGDGWVAVIDGLAPGDVLVAEPDAELYDGQRIEIESELEPDD